MFVLYVFSVILWDGGGMAEGTGDFKFRAQWGGTA